MPRPKLTRSLPTEPSGAVIARGATLEIVGPRRTAPMDEKDVRIFCEMAGRELGHAVLVDRHPSPGGIARRVGLDEKTIRTRVRRMEKSGFIQFYQADPSLALFDVGAVGVYRFESVTLATKHDVVTAVHELPMVLEAHDFIGSTVVVSFGGANAEETRVSAERLARRFELTVTELGRYPLDPAPMVPDRLDWRIVRALRYRARCTTREVARALGITPRMAEYRMARLLNSGTLRVRAILDSHRQQGLVFYELELELEETHRSEIVRALRAQYGARFWSMQRPMEGCLIANLFGFTLGEPEAAALTVLQLPGVRRCSVYIQKEAIEPSRPSWLDRAIDEKLRDLDRPMPEVSGRRRRVRPT